MDPAASKVGDKVGDKGPSEFPSLSNCPLDPIHIYKLFVINETHMFHDGFGIVRPVNA